uniref:Uncharacterized protein n=1 Tax=Avena sativa TaxID=4498 RepID=A0ACD5ZJV5_AVESA
MRVFLLVVVLLSYTSVFICVVGKSGNSRLLEKNETTRQHKTFLSSWRRKIRAGLEDEENRISHVAMYHTKPGTYYSYGTQAKIGIWGSPNQRHLQESGTSILVTSDELLNFSAIEAGFHVYPNLYNDSNVHFFVHWTKDNYKSTGCVNLICKGFVPASGAVLVPGQAVSPTSTYGGEQRYVSLRLNMHPKSGDWLLYRNDNVDKPALLGHFPNDLIPKLSVSAPLVAWCGFTSYPYGEPGPPMGSGHFPDEDETKGSTIEYIKIFDKTGYAREPLIINDVTPVLDKSDCYRVSDMYYRFVFFYGGPSGCTG